MKSLKAALMERLFMRRLWAQFRTGIEAAVVPGSGGVVFLGDSLTHIARCDLMFPTVATRNFGISGERADHLLLRLAPVIAIKPAKIFILIGSNDLNAGFSVEEIGGNVARLLDELTRALPGCKLYLQTVMPRAASFTKRILALNRLYASITAQRGITLIDLFPLFDDGAGRMRKDLTNDDLHLMGSGYAIWRDALGRFVTDAA
jgi:lysophospholipase L1-like esterase